MKRSRPAERSGFKVGDIIVEVNGEQIAKEEDIGSLVNDAKAGDVLKMKVVRDKRFMNLQLTLERRPS